MSGEVRGPFCPGGHGRMQLIADDHWECVTCSTGALGVRRPGQPAPHVQGNIVAAIREALARTGQTQAEVARVAGYTEKHVSQVLNGKAEASVSALQRLLDAAQAPLRAEHAARPAAGDTRTDRERVREAVARATAVHISHFERTDSGRNSARCSCGWLSPAYVHIDAASDAHRLHVADAVLARPELAALLDAAETVTRVRAWVVSMDDLARQYREAAAAVTAPDLMREAHDHAEDVQASADGVRRALDGRP